MALSLDKLNVILLKNEFMINRIYTIKDSCIYIELINLVNAMSVCLYIPSKYTIKINRRFWGSAKF